MYNIVNDNNYIRQRLSKNNELKMWYELIRFKVYKIYKR